jgi:putative peptide zinc metalloprotease protein
MKKAAALLAAFALLLPARAWGEATGNDNTAIAVNTKDGSSVFKLSFSVSRVMSDTVDSGNAAVAYASCSQCQTTALALQFVLLMSDPSTFTPENLALAVNVDCFECDTLASAYQFVIQAGGPVHLTPDGIRQLHAIRKELAALKDSGLSSVEIQARVDALAHQAYQVFLTELVPAGRSGDSAGAGADAATTSTSATPSSSTSSTATTEAPTTTTTDAPTSTTETTAP